VSIKRDRQYGEILFDDDSETYVTLIDTGGLTNQDNIIDNGIQLQVLNALEESDSNERDNRHSKRRLEISLNH
jgi:GTP-binding protein